MSVGNDVANVRCPRLVCIGALWQAHGALAVLSNIMSDKFVDFAQASCEQTAVDDARWEHFVPAVHRVFRPTVDLTAAGRVLTIRIDTDTLCMVMEVDEVGNVRIALFGKLYSRLLATKSFPSLGSLVGWQGAAPSTPQLAGQVHRWLDLIARSPVDRFCRLPDVARISLSTGGRPHFCSSPSFA